MRLRLMLEMREDEVVDEPAVGCIEAGASVEVEATPASAPCADAVRISECREALCDAELGAVMDPEKNGRQCGSAELKGGIANGYELAHVHYDAMDSGTAEEEPIDRRQMRCRTMASKRAKHAAGSKRRC